ncbi:MAG: hypothetical protein IPP71_01820 [Bacteroidetes bacterium]|nr:hypothetical protein [Bacteroidota bacterium]
MQKLFSVALKRNTSGIILAQNHPLGNLNHSNADLDLTKKLKSAEQILDIQIWDHTILMLNSISFELPNINL